MNNIRRKLLLILLLIIFLIGFVSSFLFANSMATYSIVVGGRDYANRQMNEFLNLALDINRSFLETIQGEWDEYVLTDDPEIREFIRIGVAPLKASAFRSLIVVIFDGESEMIYNFSEYADFDVDEHDLVVNKLIVINNEDVVFGQGNRFFIEGISLEHGDNFYEVYVGFDEQIMHDNFIALVEIETLEMLERKVLSTVSVSAFLVVALLGVLVYVVYYAQCLPNLMRRSVDDDIECYEKAITILKERGEL